MAENGNLGEFKGTTKEAIRDIREDISSLKGDIASINNKLLVVFILLAIAIIERLPTLINLVLAK